jgi:hypothetical protein
MDLVTEKLLKILSVALLSSVKFFAGVPLAFSYRLSYTETILSTMAGGMAGAVVFTYFSEAVIAGWGKIFPSKGKQKKIFTRRTRFIVRLRQKHGLAGIALLSPVLLSIPLGAFIAVRFIHDQKKILLYMFAAVIFWSLVLTSFFELFKPLMQ